MSLEALANCGPKTLGGQFLRRYWQPFARVGDIAETSARRVQLLGEHFTFLRLEGGEHALLADRCSHRGMPLCAGAVDGRGVRCAYHGWHFDAQGACTDAPGESDAFRAGVGIRSLPLRRALGLWFTYLGPGEAPTFPYGELDLTGLTTYRFAPIAWPCHFMLRVENTADVSHIGGVHRTSGLSSFLPQPYSLVVAHHDYGFQLEVWSTEERRGHPLRFFPPNAFQYRQPLLEGQPWMDHLTWHVPVDDHNTCTWTVVLVPTRDPAQFARTNPEPSASDVEVVRKAQQILAGTSSFEALRNHPNLTEIEDCVAVCGQELAGGATPSNLGVCDAGITALRDLLSQRVQAFAEQGLVTPLGSLGAVIPSRE